MAKYTDRKFKPKQKIEAKIRKKIWPRRGLICQFILDLRFTTYTTVHKPWLGLKYLDVWCSWSKTRFQTSTKKKTRFGTQTFYVCWIFIEMISWFVSIFFFSIIKKGQCKLLRKTSFLNFFNFLHTFAQWYFKLNHKIELRWWWWSLALNVIYVYCNLYWAGFWIIISKLSHFLYQTTFLPFWFSVFPFLGRRNIRHYLYIKEKLGRK